jgi:cation:H+ antiporter
MATVAALLCLGAAQLGGVGRATGALFLVALVGYVALTYRFERRHASPSAALHAAEAAEAPRARGALPGAISFFLLGLLLTIVGAHWLVEGSIALARGLGVTEAVIGLTIVAVGTSLPELVTSLVAARRGHGDVALGNVLGSNIYNVLGILGVTAVIAPIAVPEQIVTRDVWVMAASTVLLLAAVATGRQVTRGEGGLLVLLYAAYLAYLALSPAG